jgi:hypothetical protein
MLFYTVHSTLLQRHNVMIVEQTQEETPLSQTKAFITVTKVIRTEEETC